MEIKYGKIITSLFEKTKVWKMNNFPHSYSTPKWQRGFPVSFHVHLPNSFIKTCLSEWDHEPEA